VSWRRYYYYYYDYYDYYYYYEDDDDYEWIYDYGRMNLMKHIKYPWFWNKGDRQKTGNAHIDSGGERQNQTFAHKPYMN
jgi:hypothetical protein